MADLAAEFEAALGSSAVSTDPEVLARYSIDGMIPRIWCAPASAEEVSAVIGICASSGAAITPWGGGTTMQLGNLPRAVDVVLSLHRLSGVVEHDDANLTATIRAGTPVSAVQNALASRRQFVPLDPPWRIRASVGGVVAAAVNGPRRMAYGAVRDLVIGMKMVLGTGEIVKAGGKVVKNVAGYDLCKLFTGSLGTLGIITELTFKVSPTPEVMQLVLIRGRSADLISLAEDLLGSSLLPAAVVWSSGFPHPSLLLRAEGFAEAVARHVDDIRDLAGRRALDAAVLDGEQADATWRRVRDFPVVSDHQAVWRLSVSLARVGAAVRRLDEMTETHRGASRSCADLGTGTLWLVEESAGADRFDVIQALAATLDGRAVLAAAPPSLKDGIDVWGSPPPGASLMQGIKQQFDPHGILNPGRFVLGL